MSRMSLELKTVRSLMEDATRGLIAPLPAGRRASASLSAACDFVNDVLRSGVVGCLTFARSPDGARWLVVDGGRRIDAILRVLEGWDWEAGVPTIQASFDPARQAFEASPGAASIPVSDPAQLHHDIIAWFTARAAAGGATGLEDVVRVTSAVDALLETSVPVYFGDLDDGLESRLFDAVNTAGVALTREDLARARDQRGSRRTLQAGRETADADSAASCDEEVGEKPTIEWSTPSANRMVLASRRASTDFAAFAERPDFEVECSVIDAIVCTSLMFPLPEVRVCAERLIRLVGGRAGELPPHLCGRAVEHEIPRVREALGRMRPAAVLDEVELAELERALAFLLDLAHQLSPGPHELPALRYSGAFLTEPKTLDGVTFDPGIYVSQEAQGGESLRHELAHAYVHEHRSRMIRCPWIEEGLAEYLARCTVPASPSQATPSSARYYHFLWHLLALEPAAVRALLDDWLDGEAGCDHWMRIVDDYYARYASQARDAARRGAEGSETDDASAAGDAADAVDEPLVLSFDGDTEEDASHGSLPPGMAGFMVRPSRRRQDVVATGYARRALRLGELEQVVVAFHTPDDEGREQADAIAAETLGAWSARQGSAQAPGPLTADARIRCYLQAPGAEVEHPCVKLRWTGRTTLGEFHLRVPADYDASKLSVKIIISKGWRVAGEVSMLIRVVRPDYAATYVSAQEVVPKVARRYRLIFLSYARRDAEWVNRYVEELKSSAAEYFRDCEDIPSGVDWEQYLRDRVAESDLFVLFWSETSRDSYWVNRELEWAAARYEANDRVPTILPLPVEVPAAQPLPKPLVDLKLNVSTLVAEP